MDDVKLTIGSVVFGGTISKEDALKAFHETKTEPDFRTQLAAALGCPVEAVTVGNLKAVVEALKGALEFVIAHVDEYDDFGAMEISKNALAPFKMGG